MEYGAVVVLDPHGIQELRDVNRQRKDRGKRHASQSRDGVNLNMSNLNTGN